MMKKDACTKRPIWPCHEATHVTERPILGCHKVHITKPPMMVGVTKQPTIQSAPCHKVTHVTKRPMYQCILPWKLTLVVLLTSNSYNKKECHHSWVALSCRSLCDTPQHVVTWGTLSHLPPWVALWCGILCPWVTLWHLNMGRSVIWDAWWHPIWAILWHGTLCDMVY